MSQQAIAACTSCGKKYRVRLLDDAANATFDPFPCSRCGEPVVDPTSSSHAQPDDQPTAEALFDEAWQKLRQFKAMGIVLAVFSGLLFLILRSQHVPLGTVMMWLLVVIGIGCILVAVSMRRRPGRCMVWPAVLTLLTLVPIGFLIWRLFAVTSDVGDQLRGRALLLLAGAPAIGGLWLAYKTLEAIPLARNAEGLLQEQQGQGP